MPYIPCAHDKTIKYGAPHQAFNPGELGSTGVLIWRYGTTVGARATYSGVKHKISGATA